MFTWPKECYLTTYERYAFLNWLFGCLSMGLMWQVSWPAFVGLFLWLVVKRARDKRRAQKPAPSLWCESYVRFYFAMFMTFVFQGFMLWLVSRIMEINTSIGMLMSSPKVESTFIDIMFSMEQLSLLRSEKSVLILGFWIVLATSSMLFGNWLVNNANHVYTEKL